MVKRLKNPSTDKQKKEEKNSSNRTNPHIIVTTLYEMNMGDLYTQKHEFDFRDAVIISKLGIECTSDNMGQRPEIENIISTLRI